MLEFVMASALTTGTGSLADSVHRTAQVLRYYFFASKIH